jgi:hypothetical protein
LLEKRYKNAAPVPQIGEHRHRAAFPDAQQFSPSRGTLGEQATRVAVAPGESDVVIDLGVLHALIHAGRLDAPHIDTAKLATVSGDHAGMFVLLD